MPALRTSVTARTRTEVDVVFIGGGINSLGAALVLCRAGWRAIVFERNQQPGGAIRTLPLTMPGCLHDTGPMNLSQLAGSPFFAEYGDDLGRLGMKLIWAEHPFGSVLPEGRFLGLSTNRAETLAAIARFSTRDAEAWVEWNRDFKRLGPALLALLGSPEVADCPWEGEPGGDRLQGDDRQAFGDLLSQSLREQLTRRFESDAVQALVAAWGLHLDYAPDVPGGCWFPFIETNVDQEHGIPICRGGSQQLVTAMVELIRQSGGDVRTRAQVERVLVEQGRAIGVRLAGGQKIRAARAVVASVTPRALATLVDGHLGAAALAQARAWRHGPGTLMIHWTLKAAAPWIAGEARRSFYVHVGPTLDYLQAAYDCGAAGLLSRAPFCVVGQTTLFDASRAPVGQHVLWVMVRCVPDVIWGDEAGEIAGSQWTEEAKEAFASRVLRLLEDYAPGLGRQILAQAVRSPRDLERLNPNLVEGDLCGGSVHLEQFYGRRRWNGCAGHATPIGGLYYCGASSWPGGGASPSSGTMLAAELLRTNH